MKSLAESFDRYFALRFVNSQPLYRHALQIRHQVYCEELGWEPVRPDRLEYDSCDDYAFHLLLEHRATGTFAGTIRFVVPPPNDKAKELPFEKYLSHSIRRDVIQIENFTRGAFGEVSRLAVPSKFRRRRGERGASFALQPEETDVFSAEERRHFPNIAIGLYLGVIVFAKMFNHQAMFIVVEPSLKNRLQRLGLMFEQVGDPVEHRGSRALFYLPRQKFTSTLNPEMLEMSELLEERLVPQIVLYPYDETPKGKVVHV